MCVCVSNSVCENAECDAEKERVRVLSFGGCGLFVTVPCSLTTSGQRSNNSQHTGR